MYIIGIDPGKTGGITLLNGKLELVESLAFDKFGAVSCIGKILNKNIGKHKLSVFVEKVHSMPKQGVASTFTFGVQLGLILGVLEYAGVSFEQIPPQTWMKRYKHFEGITSKERVSDFVLTEYGTDNFFRTPRCKNAHSGMIDATGLAYYGGERILGRA